MLLFATMRGVIEQRNSSSGFGVSCFIASCTAAGSAASSPRSASIAPTSALVQASPVQGPDPMLLRSSPITSETTQTWVRREPSPSANRPALHRVTRLRTAFISRISSPDDISSANVRATSLARSCGSGPAIRALVPPEIATCTSAFAGITSSSSAMATAARADAAPGMGWSPTSDCREACGAGSPSAATTIPPLGARPCSASHPTIARAIPCDALPTLMIQHGDRPGSTSRRGPRSAASGWTASTAAA